MLPLYLGHAGHWVTNVITMLPVVALVGWLVIVTIRDRRRRADDPDASEPPPS